MPFEDPVRGTICSSSSSPSSSSLLLRASCRLISVPSRPTSQICAQPGSRPPPSKPIPLATAVVPPALGISIVASASCRRSPPSCRRRLKRLLVPALRSARTTPHATAPDLKLERRLCFRIDHSSTPSLLTTSPTPSRRHFREAGSANTTVLPPPPPGTHQTRRHSPVSPPDLLPHHHLLSDPTRFDAALVAPGHSELHRVRSEETNPRSPDLAHQTFSLRRCCTGSNSDHRPTFATGTAAPGRRRQTETHLLLRLIQDSSSQICLSPLARRPPPAATRASAINLCAPRLPLPSHADVRGRRRPTSSAISASRRDLHRT